VIVVAGWCCAFAGAECIDIARIQCEGIGGTYFSETEFGDPFAACTDACAGTGTTLPLTCGDNTVDPGEECDFGSFCNGGELTGLELFTVEDVQACRDEGGFPQPAAGDGCSERCKVEFCGDGIVQLLGTDGIQGTDDDEECDTGGRFNPSCDLLTCKFVRCGDGRKQGLEQCDDGNDDLFDSCTPSCRFPVCGNRVVEGFEE